MSPARRLVSYLLRYRARYTTGVACLVLASAFSLAIPWAIKGAVEGLERGGTEGLGAHVAAILVLAGAHGAARLGSRFAMVGAGQWVEHDLRRDLYASLLALPAAFHETRAAGDLLSRASNDVALVRLLAGFGAVMLVGTGLGFAGTVLAMSLLDPWLTLWAMAPFPLLVLLAKRFNHAVDRQSTAAQAALGILSTRLHEHLAGIAVVRAYTMEARAVEGFAGASRAYLARSLELARTQAVFSPLMGLIAGLGTLIVLWVGGRAVLEGRMSLGAFVAFMGYLAHLAWPTIALGWTLASIRRGLAAMARIGELLDAAPAGLDPEPGGVMAARRLPAAALEFRSLTWGYAGRAAAVRGVSFAVPAGGLAVVVGTTGSGKSTLGALLCRLHEPPRGAVFADGTDVRDVPLATFRRSVGYVPQEPFLFSRSLRDNLRLADEAAGDARLRAAAEAAGLGDDLTTLPEGWATVVGERGLMLSGGQRQRVALARALVTDPSILVLDDPFAAVDAGMEAQILTALSAARSGRTTLLMTHRLRAAEEADVVVVLEAGEVVEQGTHEGLLAGGGRYAALWRAQQLADEVSRA